MQLNEQGLIKERALWEAAGYKLPEFDHAEMVKRTKEKPFWLHFGAGNIFRAFQTNVVQELLNSGRVTQDQYNQAVQMAQQFQKMMGR